MKLLALAVIAALATAGAVYHMAGQKAKVGGSDIPTPVWDSFTHWMRRHGRAYGSDDAEKAYRAGVYYQNYKGVVAHNNAKKTWTLALNDLADMTQEEVQAKMTGFKPANLRSAAGVKKHVKLGAWETVDWNAKGAVTPIKNQGQCGSCWAFSTTGSVEGAYWKKHGELKSFSEQQLVDCDTQQDQGCNGGLMDNAFQYIKSGNPLMLEDDYSYRGRQSTCRYDSSQGVGTVSAYADVDQSSDAMKKMLDNGPVSVAIEADQMVFQMYQTGVITGSSCGTQLDHGVLAVGYGTEDGEDYFLVKNSWGPSWGDNGFVKIGADNVCGILQSASQPTA